MKFVIAGMAMACHLCAFLPQAVCQAPDGRLHHAAGNATIVANSIERAPSFPSIIRLKGNVEIRTKAVVQHSPVSLMIMIVTADEADYHEDSGEIEARGKVHVDYRDDPVRTNLVGNVRIKLEPARQEGDSKSN
jgi:lipopolysaccharide assembly outer membrane protein LptD (OstA)